MYRDTSRSTRTVIISLLIATCLLAACGSDAVIQSNAAETQAESNSEAMAARASDVDAAADDGDHEDDHDHDDEDDHDHEDDDDDEDDHDHDDENDNTTGVDLSLFFDGALAEEVTTEDCTLSGGVETTCYRITVGGYPVSYDVGPFCPDTITDTADAGGIWFDGDDVYDLDGAFITGLAELYDDDNWLMYDEDGNVNVTETADEFDAAARPDVDPSLQNHCVEGRLEWLDNGEPIPTTVLIPVEPVLADSPGASSGNLGVTLDGVVIAESAPVDAILAAYTVAAFDDCGGHFNPFDGYHLHGAVGCSEADATAEGETAMFGYAMDGYPVFSAFEDPASVELDECNGHTTDAAGYHYHANSAEQNQVIECLIGQTVAGAAGLDGGPPDAEHADDVGAPGGQAGGPDFAAAAEALGVTEQALTDALGGPPPDFEQAAETLGITLEELAAVLPLPPA